MATTKQSEKSKLHRVNSTAEPEAVNVEMMKTVWADNCGPFGHGTRIGVRPNGTEVFELNWVLAGGKKALLYRPPSTYSRRHRGTSQNDTTALRSSLVDHPNTKTTRLHLPSFGSVNGSNTGMRQRIITETKAKKKLAPESQKLAWDHYLQHRPIRNEETDTPLGFDQDDNGNIIRDPVTGKPSHSCCKWGSSIRSVQIEEFSDLGPGLALTFRFMLNGGWGFLAAFLLSCIGWGLQVANPKNHRWVTVSWMTDLLLVFAFTVWMVWLRRDMVLHDEEVDSKDITSSDYSVKISNLPADATADELAVYFSQFGELHKDVEAPANLYDNDFDRTGVSVVRNDASFIGAAFALVECDEEVHSTAPENVKARQAVAEKRKRLVAKYNELRNPKDYKYTCAGVAFVTFRYQDGAEACRRGLRTGNFRYHLTHGANGLDRSTKRIETIPYRNGAADTTCGELSCEIAPDPSDLLWRNLQNSKCTIITRQIFIGGVSMIYLFGLAILMAFFAAHAREYQKPTTRPPFNIGLLAVLGNVACCLTSIVLLMPIISTFEGVHSRSMLEIIAFLKLGFFQTMGVVVGTLYVYSLDEESADKRAFSSEQLAHVGSGLPTSNCSIPRFYFNTTTNNGTRPVPRGWENVYDLDPRSCKAFTLHLFGTGMGGYLIGTLIADILLINMIDFLCPPWWIETMNAIKKTFQIDLNKIYEGVDYKPFLRYQILLKFLMTAMFLSHIDNPRILYLWVAICFWQSFEIDRYCYVLRYRTPPYYSSKMYQIVIIYVLPIALIVHGFMHVFFFGLDWKWSKENGLDVFLFRDGWPQIMMCVIVLIFLIVWFLPLKFWRFGVHPDQTKYEKDDVVRAEALTKSGGDLDFSHALTCHEDDHSISHLKFVNVEKYIPNPIRREFGVLKLN